MRKIFLLSVVFSLVFISCDRKPCQNTNEILNENTIETDNYISELVKLIDNSDSEVSYWFDSYVKEGQNEYLIIDIQSTNICAKGKFLVRDWTGIEQIQKVEGQSYQGAKLKGFRFEMDTVNNCKVLLYKSLGKIVD